MSALIAPATQAALLPSGNVEATDPAYELDFTGDHKYQGGTVTFTQDEISFRGDAFEIAKDAAPTMLNGEGKIFFYWARAPNDWWEHRSASIQAGG